jgi:predicted amidohydrolase
MAQVLVRCGDVPGNLARAAQRIAQAKRAGCDVVVLPECLDIGWCDGRAHTLAQPVPGAVTDTLAQAARAHRIHVVAGVVERDGANLYNSAVLIDDTGALRLVHRKLNELDTVTGGLYARGDRLAVAHTRLGTLGIAVCADNAPDALEIGDVLARMGAEIVLSPCAWAVPPEDHARRAPYGDLWQRAYGELAHRHGLPVVGVSSVGRLDDGQWAGWPVIGASLAMDGDGHVVAQAPYGDDADTLMVARMTLRTTPGPNLG